MARGGGVAEEENKRRRSGELRRACERSSTPGHRRHTATIQPYQAETTPSGASPVSFFCINPLAPPSRLRPAARFSARFPPEPLVSPSFRRCTAAYNEWCTPSKALRSLFFSRVPLSSPPLPSHIPSFISSLGVLLAARSPRLDLLSFLSPFPTLHHGNK